MRNDFQFNARRVLTSAAVAFAFAAAAPYAIASGGGSGGGGGGGGGGGRPQQSQQQEDLTTCPQGQIWDVKHKRCLTQRSDVLPDDQIVEYAFALDQAQRYDEALQTLDLLKNPNTPRALNYRGHATRKLGHIDEGIVYYLKSVAMDPNYAQVREYLGEAYALQGKFDLARQQLASIAKICGSTSCEEYEDLSKALTHPGGA